jgi:L-alanine-DL-glutamate epimerase-like enolase superfamily enzyme
MRIKHIDIKPLRSPLLQPFRVATGQHDSLDNLLVVLTLDNGVVGFGEAAVATHITGETIALTRSNLEACAQCLVDQDVCDYLKLSNWLHDSFPRNKAAVCAMEMALFDVLTQSMKIPLWQMFGASLKILQSDITIVISSLEQTQEKTQEFHAQGFKSFKIKIGQDMDLDFKRVQAVRTIVPQSSIILDANQGYSAKETLSFLELLHKAKIQVDLIEQPTVKGDIEGLKQVSRLSKVLVCADESASSIGDVIHLIQEKAVGAINIKLMKTGIVHSIEIARLAKAHGIKLMIGGMMESNLAMSASAHLAAGLACFDFIDLDTPFFIKGEAPRNPYLSDNGIYNLSKAQAGIGIKPIIL